MSDILRAVFDALTVDLTRILIGATPILLILAA